jgi:hypothetical protein
MIMNTHKFILSPCLHKETLHSIMGVTWNIPPAKQVIQAIQFNPD